MSLSTLPLCYCTNVHPGRTLAEVLDGLERFAAPVRQQYGAPMAVGLWFADSVSRQLADSAAAREDLLDLMDRHQLSCHTLNAFPFGDFHGERVKELVYLPNWAEARRLSYTVRCAEILADIIPEGREGSISTLPLGFSPASEGDDFLEACFKNFIAAALRLDELHESTGKMIRMAIEPEPFCRLETTPETTAFFRRLFSLAEHQGCRPIVEEHVGVCYDVCHQAVEFEDAAESIATFATERIRINKVQLSCAVELSNPARNAVGRESLAAFVEPRYLHQIFARSSGGQVMGLPDLTPELCESPPSAFLNADTWRVHFHVPVNETRIGELRTTRPDLETALAAIAELDYAPHLEVETYTWEVLPPANRPTLIEGIAAELHAIRELID